MSKLPHNRYLLNTEEWAAVAAQRPRLHRDRGKPGRNAPCPCGSGKKYKACCGAPHSAPRRREPETPAKTPATSPADVRAAQAEALRRAGGKPEVVYAFEKTGVLITPLNRPMQHKEIVEAWDAAIEEYRGLHP